MRRKRKIRLGVLYAAVYFRTGSLIPGIISHWIVDFTSFMTPESSGAMSVRDIILGIAFGSVMAAIGYWYIRPKKRGEIAEVWSEKWPLVSAEGEASGKPE